jgi:hypothetical protein
LDLTAASQALYIPLVRKIARLSRAIGETPPLDLEGSHAALHDVGGGPDLWSVLRAHGIGRDFAAVGEQFAVLPCLTDDVALDDDESSDANVADDDFSVRNLRE